jgi:hypothetical protein
MTHTDDGLFEQRLKSHIAATLPRDEGFSNKVMRQIFYPPAAVAARSEWTALSWGIGVVAFATLFMENFKDIDAGALSWQFVKCMLLFLGLMASSWQLQRTVIQ